MKFEDLKGKTIIAINISEDKECMEFDCDDGYKYRLMYHHDCCANCEIIDICGDLEDITGSPLVVAELVMHPNVNPEGLEKPKYSDHSFTWSFYKFDTIKGGVTIRWYGSSNGYYSETVTLGKYLPDEDEGWENYF